MPSSQLQELINPAQSQILVVGAALLLALVGAAWGFVAARGRGLVLALGGPLVLVLWQIHGALMARFGMDSLGLLLAEAAFVVMAGAGLGTVWGRIVGAPPKRKISEENVAAAPLAGE